MIINNQPIGPLQISNTYDNVIHLSVFSPISSLYKTTHSLYNIYDGIGNNIPFRFEYGCVINVDGGDDSSSIKTEDIIFEFDNCTYQKISKDVSNVTVMNLLTSNQVNVKTKFTTTFGYVNHTLDASVSAEHKDANNSTLQSINDSIANVEYFKIKSEQLKSNINAYVRQYEEYPDPLLVAYTNNGTSVTFKISNNQFPPSGQLRLAIIGVATMYIGETDGYTLYANMNFIHNGNREQLCKNDLAFGAYASTGKGGDAECSVNFSFTATKVIQNAGTYTVEMVLPRYSDSASIVVLCG